MRAEEFDPNLIRLPLDYKGTPALAEIRVNVPSIVPPDVSNGEFAIGLELRDQWGFHLPKQSAHLELSPWKAQAARSRQPCRCCRSTIVTTQCADMLQRRTECFVCACATARPASKPLAIPVGRQRFYTRAITSSIGETCTVTAWKTPARSAQTPALELWTCHRR